MSVDSWRVFAATACAQSHLVRGKQNFLCSGYGDVATIIVSEYGDRRQYKIRIELTTTIRLRQPVATAVEVDRTTEYIKDTIP